MYSERGIWRENRRWMEEGCGGNRDTATRRWRSDLKETVGKGRKKREDKTANGQGYRGKRCRR